MLLRVLLAGLALVALGSADIVKIDDGDTSRIAYLPTTEQHGDTCGKADATGNEECTKKWWVDTDTNSDGGKFHNTWGPETYLTLTTKGTKIIIWGTQFKKSAVGSVSVNGTVKLGNFNDQKSADDTPQFKQIASFDIPNPQGVENTITIAYELDATNALQTPTDPKDRFYLGIDYIQVDEPKEGDTNQTPPNDPDSSSSSSSSSLSTSSSTTTTPGTGPTPGADSGNSSNQNNSGNPSSGNSDTGNKDNSNANANANANASTDTKDEQKGVFSSDKAKLGLVIAGSIVAGIVVLAILWAIFKRVRHQAKVNAEISEIMETQLNNENAFPPYHDSPSVKPAALPTETRPGPGAYGPQGGGASYPFAYPPMRSQTPMAAPPLMPPSRTGTPQSFMGPGSSFYPPAPADPSYHPLLATGYVDVRSQSPAYAGAPIPPPGLSQMAPASTRSPAPQDLGRPIPHTDHTTDAYDAVTMMPPLTQR